MRKNKASRANKSDRVIMPSSSASRPATANDASAAGEKSAAANPMRMTATMSCIVVCDRPAATKPIMRMVIPISRILFTPNLSVSAPPRKNSPCWLNVRSPNTKPIMVPVAANDSDIYVAKNGTTR